MAEAITTRIFIITVSTLLNCERRIIAGNARDAVTHDDREKTAIIGRCGRWSGVWGFGCAGNVHAILLPLIFEWGWTCSRHSELGCLSNGDRLVGRLSRDRGGCLHREGRVIARDASRAISHYDREESAVVARCDGRSNIGGTGGSSNAYGVLTPLIA